ncbi:MAG TPA: crotonobetainyl-CoA--carnitine CoA-transferase [Actinophytocola sp.]|jgi:hypothetical protein|uniref:crotonobetainyl-CoA--carnitine CoA-transferase n=1 Tax=Actinophytocola sp. TaxID=1872138 RepID=UPI002DFC142F|nr:crotonobetainyl-CoA--carnitine CoA-transferase [Actinophytocola sp.]
MNGDLTRLAQAYVDRRFPQRAVESIASVIASGLRWDEEYCRRVAACFDQAPLFGCDARLTRLYDRFKQENLQQYQVVLDAGIAVEPWLSPGQPYPGSAELRGSVRSTGVLHVYLTSAGHGPGPARRRHPMLAPSGIVASGVEFSHNDIFRAVHDIFGHVMSGGSFAPRGEFKASFVHMRMYPDEVHPVLFTEQIAQICWFFFGPKCPAGQYPEQKVFEFPRHYLDEFRNLFTVRRGAA